MDLFIGAKRVITGVKLAIFLKYSDYNFMVYGIQDRPFLLHLRRFTCVALAQAGLVVGQLRPSVRPLVCPQHFWGAKFV